MRVAIKKILSVVVLSILVLAMVLDTISHFKNGNLNNWVSVLVKDSDFVENSKPSLSQYEVCFAWSQMADEWWTHHPTYELGHENETHHCYQRMVDSEEIKFNQDLYKVQFSDANNCSNITTKGMWSSGWHATFRNVIDGLLVAIEEKRPIQMTVAHTKQKSWLYAGKKDGTKPTCDSKDMYCYFLNMTKCAPNDNQISGGGFRFPGSYVDDYPRSAWAYKYASRPQTWLRKKVYEMLRRYDDRFAVCHAAFHVRRADVALGQKRARRYHAIEEYVNASGSLLSRQVKPRVLLLTDDQNAIEEAETLFPGIVWLYLDRKRHRGASGGWENQIPSDSPEEEVVTILATFKLLRDCDALVYSTSGFARHLRHAMGPKNASKTFINLDEGVKHVFSAQNTQSVTVSRSRYDIVHSNITVRASNASVH